MNEAPLRLYVDARFTSPYAMSVFVTLTEKAIDFELIKVNLGTQEQSAPDYAELSLTQRVPTLVHGGFALSESSAIIEYLDERFPSVPVLPRGLEDKARARQIQAWLRSDLMPIREERSTLVIFYAQAAGPLSPEGQAAKAKLIHAAQALLADGRQHLFGDWSIADVELAVMLNRLLLNGDEMPEPLRQYARRQWLRPSVQAWVNVQRPSL
ncbi:glutathione transferase [Pseudomonas sp. GD03842]|uniref:glutathione transferase n=1 Tax=Pseudomonas sp. GD03842 TaxID=2975385 RepID=UPI00244C4CFB|nr:glutathione transferase [Pseudomonas sp. GD03842]MDH0747023.1 glutathione transferase [Pseudomonas sp. GD03842]